MADQNDSREIAALIAQQCREQGISYNNTKIQKLLYCCYGVLLAWRGERICDEYPRLWPYGPVFPKVFKYIQKHGDIICYSFERDRVATPDNLEVVKNVLRTFGQYNATSLSRWSHADDSPWARVKNQEASWNSFIPDEYIKEYFQKKVLKNA